MEVRGRDPERGFGDAVLQGLSDTEQTMAEELAIADNVSCYTVKSAVQLATITKLLPRLKTLYHLNLEDLTSASPDQLRALAESLSQAESLLTYSIRRGLTDAKVEAMLPALMRCREAGKYFSLEDGILEGLSEVNAFLVQALHGSFRVASPQALLLAMKGMPQCKRLSFNMADLTGISPEELKSFAEALSEESTYGIDFWEDCGLTDAQLEAMESALRKWKGDGESKSLRFGDAGALPGLSEANRAIMEELDDGCRDEC